MRAREFIKEDGDATSSGDIAAVVVQPLGSIIRRNPKPPSTKKKKKKPELA